MTEIPKTSLKLKNTFNPDEFRVLNALNTVEIEEKEQEKKKKNQHRFTIANFTIPK